MIERLLRQIFELLVFLVILSFLFGTLVGLVRGVGAVAVGSVSHVLPRVFGDTVATVLIAVFLVGLGARAHRALTGRGGRGGREHAVHERQARLAVRRAAEGVPEIVTHEPPEDSDPALAVQEDE